MTPKAEIKQNKRDEVVSLSNKIKSSKSVVFVDYTGMDMVSQQSLQKKLKEQGAKMLVAKNSLVEIAAKEAGIEADLSQILTGQTAVVFSGEDAVASIQIVGQSLKEIEKPKFKAGVMESVYYDGAKMLAISKLPSKQTLLANTVGAISAPLYGLVSTLSGNLNALVWTLTSRRDQLGK